MNDPVQPNFLNESVICDVPRKAQRDRAIKAAFKKADKFFLGRYETFLNIFGSVRSDFIAGEATDAYIARYGAISDTQKKALGKLYQDLIRNGTLIKTNEYRARNQGNASAVYRLKRR